MCYIITNDNLWLSIVIYMNKLITDIKAIQEETLDNLKSSNAINTIRAYRSDFKDFSAFCSKNGLKYLPTDAKIVSLYITFLSSKNIKISTLKRRLVSISMIHKLKGHYLCLLYTSDAADE